MTIPSQRTSREIRSGRMNRRPPSFVVTLVALAIVFALAWTFFMRSGPSASAPVVGGIPGDVHVAAADAVHRADRHVQRRREPQRGRQSRAEWRGPRRPAPALGVRCGDPERQLTLVTKGAVTTDVRRIGAWPPAWRLATHSPLDYQGLAAIVRTAVEDGDDTVGIKPLKEGDRAVWRAAMTLDGKQIDLVVDQQTGIVTWYSDGEETFTATVDWASPPPADPTYTVDAPAGTR